jgi:hypothetical protein
MVHDRRVGSDGRDDVVPELKSENWRAEFA